MVAPHAIPEHVQDHSWTIMDHWQQLIETRPDDEAIHALLILLVDVWLSHLQVTHGTTTEQMVLFVYRDLVPRIITYFLTQAQDAATEDPA